MLTYLVPIQVQVETPLKANPQTESLFGKLQYKQLSNELYLNAKLTFFSNTKNLYQKLARNQLSRE